MDLETLRIFVEVVRQQNITRAATLLNVAQPAVTRRIHAMEDQMGTLLLARHQRGVHPTEAGTLLFERAQLLLRLVDELPQEVLSRAAEPAGQVHFGFPPALGNVFVFGMVSEFLRRCPLVSLSLHEEFSQGVHEGLVAGRIDIGIMNCETDYADLQWSPLFEEPVWLISHASRWPFGTSPTLAPAQLVGLPLLISSFLRLSLKKLSQAQGLQFNVRLEADAFLSLYEGLRRGVGFLLAPPSTVSRDLASGEFRAASVSGMHVNRGLFWRHDRPLTRAMLELADTVHAEAAQLRMRNPDMFMPLRPRHAGRQAD